MTKARDHLIRTLWPDKTIQAGVVVLLASVASLLFYIERSVFDITFAKTVPSFLRAEASQVMAFLALVAGILAVIAIRRKHVGWGWAAVAMSALSVGPLGSGIIFGIVGAGFLLFAHREGEHKAPATRELQAFEWPDKAFAASILLIVAGVISLLWAGALLLGGVSFSGLSSLVMGFIALASGVFSIAVAPLLRQEKAYWAGIAASILSVIGLGFYVVAPLLGLAALALLLIAHREGEFQTD